MTKYLGPSIQVWAALFAQDADRLVIASEALRQEASDDYLREVLHLAHLYVGFPRVVQALNHLPPAESQANRPPRREGARQQLGEQSFREIYGEDADPVLEHLRKLDPQFADLVLGHAYGEVFAQSLLDLMTRERLSVLALLATNCELQARSHMRACLRHGATVDQMHADLRLANWLSPEQIALGDHCLQEEQARRS